MTKSRIQLSLAITLPVFFFSWGIAAGSDVDMKILRYPDHISKFVDLYVRVKIANNGKIPLRGCDRSEEKCIALGWDFVESPSVMSVPGKNIAPIQFYANGALTPGEVLETNIRIPTGALAGGDAVVSLFLVVKEEQKISLIERRLNLRVKQTPRRILNRRVLVRTMVYSYLALSVLMLGVFLFTQKDQN